MNRECTLIADDLHAYVEGGLDPLRSRIVEAHLSECSTCLALRRRMEEERLWLIESIVKTPALSPRLRGRVLESIRATHRRSRTARLRDRLFRLAGAAAAAAVLILAAVHSPRSPLPSKEDLASGFLPSEGTSRVTDAPELATPRDGWGAMDSVAKVYPASYVPDRSRDLEEEISADGERPSDREALLLVRFPDVLNYAAKLNGNYPRDLPRRDPCRPDPNRDGRLDLLDVSYSYQVFMTGATPDSFESREAPVVDPECEDICLKA